MLSNAVSLKFGDHQLIHSSYDEPQEAYENIWVSDVGLYPHNLSIEDEVHEDKFHYSESRQWQTVLWPWWIAWFESGQCL